ncbi:MAG: type II toxin-antitoxin system YafQ family toxin [Bacilli bacterium]|nr:type II toxin-antitoxin system YafQ family toxin [Bacilli bacterium]
MKRLFKQGKDDKKLEKLVDLLSKDIKLDVSYKNHKLNDDKFYKNCYESHIEPDWLLIYQYIEEEHILLLVSTGSHSDLFKI